MMAEKFDFKKFFIASAFTLICSAINFAGAKFAAVVHIPLYLDSILTISVVALFQALFVQFCLIWQWLFLWEVPAFLRSVILQLQFLHGLHFGILIKNIKTKTVSWMPFCGQDFLLQFQMQF